MMKEIVEIELTESFKEKVMDVIDDAINNVMTKSRETIPTMEINKIRNLSLDQINVNITTRANLKTLWVINVESKLPIVVEKEKEIPSLKSLNSNSLKSGAYKMKPNLTWTYNKDNVSDGGVDWLTFEKTVLTMLLEDAETAAFYGALTCVDDRNG